MRKLNLEDLKSDNAETKYHCAKQAIALSEKNPKGLYPQLKVFTKLLDGENRVLKWVAIIIIGNLARADAKSQIDRLVPKLIGFLKGKEMITANNAIMALGKIAASKPKFKGKIFQAFLGVEKAVYYNKGQVSPECRNIALGKALEVFSLFKTDVQKSSVLLAFIGRQVRNSRPATGRKARVLLKAFKP
ncbi:hypothetical protein C4546_04875 [Candidatus Parcubacteria bacterium]|jgi:hypothetical protein|nr:MAG: hypothetical protein C4546_04875 [Candidatus Parcubacteria bacterium]